MAYDTVNFQNLPVNNGGQDEDQTTRPTHLLLESTPVRIPALAIMDMTRQGVEWLSLEQAPPHAAPECRISEIVENADRLIEAP